jgi:hypothetical protein
MADPSRPVATFENRHRASQVMQLTGVLATEAGCGLLLLCALSSPMALAQKADRAASSRTMGGAVTVTNNGISLLPTFSLNKPAVMFDGLVGGPRLSFEPQLRFALEGRPWSFIFWWRYRVLGRGRLSVTVGAHPALVFRTVPASMDADSVATIVAHRYLAAEVSPRYAVGKGITVGVYYLYSHGLEDGATRNTHFVTLNGNFANLALSERLSLRVSPQIYYLRMDETDGYYATATVSLFRRDFPLSVQSIVNHAIDTNIPADDFVWNVSLIYSFRREYEGK